MIPAEFDYQAPESLGDALSLLSGTPGAKLVAGGMSLIPAMKHRLSQPSLLVDLGRVRELEGSSEKRGTLRFGARTTHREVPLVVAASECPILAETAEVLGDRQVRNRGTLCGSLVHADPAADWPAVFLALSGEAKIVGAKGERRVKSEDFFLSMLTSAVGEDEILAEVSLEYARKRAGTAYEKLRQPASGFAIVGVAAQIELDRKGRVNRAQIGVTGINPVPFRAASLEAALRGATPEPHAVRAACEKIAEADPMGDIHASSEYRAHLLSVFATRAVSKAAERARQ